MSYYCIVCDGEVEGRTINKPLAKYKEIYCEFCGKLLIINVRK